MATTGRCAIRVAALAAWLIVGPAGNGVAVEIAVVAEAGGADLAAVVAGLGDAAGEGGRVAVHRLPAGGIPDPIQRGRMLARVQSADLIVTIGDRATELMLAEREKIPVYFVGAASLVSGAKLQSPDVAGILPYSIEATLALVQAIGLAPLGLAYTPGFARVAERIEAEALALGMPVVRRAIGSRSAVGPAVRGLMREVRSVWVLGDPLLTRGAGFDFLVEQSLASSVPVVAPLRDEVKRGALLAFEPEWSAVAARAVEHIQARLAGAPPDDSSRVLSSPASGMFLIHRVLGARLSAAVPDGTSWQHVP